MTVHHKHYSTNGTNKKVCFEEAFLDLGLQDKVVAVAAASQGLGRAIAYRLAQEGARVAICGRDEGALKGAAQAIHEATGAKVLAIRADLTQAEQVKQFVDEAAAHFSGLDALVTNAGGPPAGNFLDFDDRAWGQAFQLVLMSVVRLIRASIPHLKARGGGRIVNVTSVSVKQPIDDLLLSNTLRMGVLGLSKSLANELGPENITVNCVCPGYTETARLGHLFARRAEAAGLSADEVRTELAARVPLRRLGQPEELADLVALLCSGRAGYLTGAAVQVDGGTVQGYY